MPTARRRVLATSAASVLAGLLVLTACSSGHKAAPVTPSTADGSLAAGASTGPVPSGAAASSAAASASASSAAAKSGAAAKASGSVASAARTSGAGQPNPPAGSKAIVPTPSGTYDYSSSGTSTVGAVPSTSTLVVSAPTGGTQRSVQNSGGSSETETLEYRADGVYLDELDLVAKMPPYPSLDEDLKPTNGPVRVIPTGAPAGTHTTFVIASATASATVTFTVIGTTSATVAGKSYPALHISLASTNLAGSVDGISFKNGSLAAESWISPVDGLPYKQHLSDSVSALGQTIASDITATLTSTKPS